MLFSYNWLQSFFKKKLPKANKLAEVLTMHSFEVEEVEKIGKDWVLDIDILPNRGPDCFSHLGIAREISAVLDTKLRFEDYSLKEGKYRAKDFIELKVKSKKDCLRYTARVVTDVKIAPSPKWLRDRLKILGLKPINNVVDIANYVMLETGQPLHAFDLDKILDQKIIIRRAKKGEKIITLDNERYKLNKDILVISDVKDPLAIAGIKGGKKAEITKKTKVIVLESANFNPRVVRKGSKKIDLKTDASWRFEHGLDLNLTEFGINGAAYLIGKIAGGKICKGLVDFYPKKVSIKKIKLDLDYVESLLGVRISTSRIKNILKRLGFKFLKSSTNQLMIEIPSFRLDVSIPEDLIEEIGRIYGYEKIPSVFPKAALIPPERNLNVFWEDMTKNILKEAEFTEIYSSSFINKEEAKLFGYRNFQLIETENPISADFQYLRPSLIPKVLKSFQENQKFLPANRLSSRRWQASFNDIRIFELGKIFKNEKDKEKTALTGLMTGEVFYEAKGVIDLLLNNLGISDIWYDQYQPTPEESKAFVWNSKRRAEIKIGNEEVGFLGEISSKITEALKLNAKVVIFDFDFEKLQELVSEEQEFRPISPYPSAVRDIAVLVPRDVLVEEVLNKIEGTGLNLIKDVDLFDIYEGEEIAEGKKNLAFHIIYQAEDRTLTSKEIDDIQEKIIKVLEKDPEWEVRK
ncbi:MAG: phenylalanine--tRNA ligase subunit beta [Candidatus Nealsonbacteria bacterium]|nr:MAG: phenylalanine--tRNA ligase subunit beta [Candidatus Nealsonbacteria bacterium]